MIFDDFFFIKNGSLYGNALNGDRLHVNTW